MEDRIDNILKQGGLDLDSEGSIRNSNNNSQRPGAKGNEMLLDAKNVTQDSRHTPRVDLGNLLRRVDDFIVDEEDSTD